MGKNNQQRRAAKRKARAASRPAPGPAPHPSAGQASADPTVLFAADPADRARDLLVAGARVSGNPLALDDAVQDLVIFGGTVGAGDGQLAARTATTLLLEQIDLSYAHGWQPADLVHVARRVLGTRLAKLAGALVMQHARLARAVVRAPQEWADQLVAMGVSTTDEGVDRNWNVLGHIDFRQTIWESWHDVLGLMGHWSLLVGMPALLPTPSSWPAARRVTPGPVRPAGHDPKKLATIRALLAKAEATEFVEEADTFTAKAQDLMTRYAIDEALLADPDDAIDIRSRRVHIDNPYAATKAQLLATVGKVNLVKTIWDDQHGIATIVGLPVDLDLAEMLFTSLLVQATKAMTEAGAVSEGGHRLDRSPSFRRAFLLSYANRVGERLTDAGQHAQQEESVSRGRDLVPVFARQSAAVDTEFARLFPRTTSSGAKRVDARGWQAGRAAADRAVLARGQVDGRSA